MSQLVMESIDELEKMRKYPKEIFYKGNLSLLKRPKISIVGTRRPSAYTRQFTYTLAQELSKRGICVVSGAAMGVDTIAHEGAGFDNTIAVVANGLDIRYPVVNQKLIANMEEKGLVLSQFNDGFRATGWSFVVRNEVVVALGDWLVVAEADLNSGSMRSVEFAQKMGKKIFVLPHRLGESLATHALVAKGEATVIEDIDLFVSQFGKVTEVEIEKDAFFYFCQKGPTFDACIEKFGERVYEAELEGIITIQQGIVRLN